MESIKVPKPQTTDYEKVNVATEEAFNELVKQANAQGLPIAPVTGLMYLPDQPTTYYFQQACRSVLRVLWQGDPATFPIPNQGETT